MPTYRLSISAPDTAAVIRRYCPGCGKVAPFQDSGGTRRNANGKTIHVFAIYKCPRDHTWNRPLPRHEIRRRGDPPREPGFPATVDLEALRAEGFTKLEIEITTAGGRARLDRVLADAAPGLSRCEWRRRLAEGLVLIDGRRVKPGCLLSKTAVASMDL